MARKVKAIVKLQVPSGKATPAPPVGPALGQHGANIMGFVKEFNARTASLGETIVPVVITIFDDRSFTFITKTSPASELLKKSAGAEKGSGSPLHQSVGKVTRKQVEGIAKTKMTDLNAATLEGAIRIVEGTARSMGIQVGE